MKNKQGTSGSPLTNFWDFIIMNNNMDNIVHILKQEFIFKNLFKKCIRLIWKVKTQM